MQTPSKNRITPKECLWWPGSSPRERTGRNRIFSVGLVVGNRSLLAVKQPPSVVALSSKVALLHGNAFSDTRDSLFLTYVCVSCVVCPCLSQQLDRTPISKLSFTIRCEDFRRFRCQQRCWLTGNKHPSKVCVACAVRLMVHNKRKKAFSR